MQKIILSLLLTAGFSSVSWAACEKGGPDDLAKGKTLYTEKCLMCHGAKGDAGPDAVAAAALNPKPRNFMENKFKVSGKEAAPTLSGLYKVVTEGLPGTAMAPFFDPKKQPAEACAVANYVMSLHKK